MIVDGSKDTRFILTHLPELLHLNRFKLLKNPTFHTMVDIGMNVSSSPQLKEKYIINLTLYLFNIDKFFHKKYY